MKSRIVSLLAVCGLISAALWGASCGSGGGSGNTCDVVNQTGCKSGEICENVSDGTTGCFAPLIAKGDVFDCTDATKFIAGARVVAMDVNGSPESKVAITDASGNYQLTVPTKRNTDGTPSGDNFTLRSDAAAYQTFPSGLRQPIPITTSGATKDSSSGDFVIQNSLTNVCMSPLAPGFGTASIHGTVTPPKHSLGALVVAESSPTAGFSAIADRDGSYEIFNLAAGTYGVTPYAQNANYDSQSVTLAAADDKEADFSPNTQAGATLNGSVQIVNPNPGTSPATSVILVVESTFNDALARGETPPGLRAPAPGIAPDITNAFTISGIPAGHYVVLAAFENDDLVRDPDTCIAGTAILHETLTAGQADTLGSGFKITGALDVISPGADGVETVTTSTPVLTFARDSSAKDYKIQVFDNFGNKIWETVFTPAPDSGNPSVTYNADGTGAGSAQPLEHGNFYQFRVTSIDTGGCEISRTEDLKGVFFVQ